MSSTNKTPNLKLNSWVGADVPCREDFVRDNNIIDDKITTHCSDTSIHITPQERKTWNSPVFVQSYFGDNNDSQVIDLYCDFEPRWGFVYASEYPINRCDVRNNTNYHYFGFFTKGVNEPGLKIEGKRLTVYNTPSLTLESELLNFNQRGIPYNIIAFR